MNKSMGGNKYYQTWEKTLHTILKLLRAVFIFTCIQQKKQDIKMKSYGIQTIKYFFAIRYLPKGPFEVKNTDCKENIKNLE